MNNKVNFLRGTATEYEATTKDNDTFYYTTDTKKLYLGETEITGIEIDDTSATATDKTWSAKKISEHTGNDEIHVTAEDKTKWNAVNYSNPNLLINPDFKINQRGVAGTISTAGYFADRWKLDNGEVTINSDGTLTLNGTISQTLENAVGDNATASASAGTASYDNSTKTFTLTATGETIAWAKLEIGSIATPFIPPDSATELAKCQRYYAEYNPYNYAYCNVGIGTGWTNNRAAIYLTTPVPMRELEKIMPTLEVSGSWSLTNDNVPANDIPVSISTTVYKSNTSANRLLVVCEGEGIVVGQTYSLRTAGDTTAKLSLSAEL